MAMDSSAPPSILPTLLGQAAASSKIGRDKLPASTNLHPVAEAPEPTPAPRRRLQCLARAPTSAVQQPASPTPPVFHCGSSTATPSTMDSASSPSASAPGTLTRSTTSQRPALPRRSFSRSLSALSQTARSAGYPSLRDGFVYKRSAWRKAWTRRYLVLGDEGLFSYRARGEVAPSLEIVGVREVLAVEESGMQVVTAAGTLHFWVDDTRERDAWVDLIKLQLLPGHLQ